jgi:hypothetical protein
MHSLLLTKENLQTRIKPLSNDSVRHIRRQNTHTAGEAGLEPAARKHVVPKILIIFLIIKAQVEQARDHYTDNMAAQQLSQDESYRRRTRHLDNRYHYIRDQVCKKHLIVIGIPGKENPADTMTKLISMQCLKS